MSLAVGLYENMSSGWIEGAAILFAVLLVALVTATNDYRKESQFRKLNAKKDDITIGVIRGGVSININVKDLVSSAAAGFCVPECLECLSVCGSKYLLYLYLLHLVRL